MLFRALAFLVAIVCVAPVQAQESPRFVYLSYGWIIQNTAQGRRIFADFQALEGRLQEQYRTKVEELHNMDRQLNSSSLSEEGRNRLARDFDEARMAFQVWQEEIQSQLNDSRGTATRQFQLEIDPIIDELAKERGLNYVMQIQDGVLAWADSSLMEFTEEVAKRYDAAYPGTGSAAARPAAQAPAR